MSDIAGMYHEVIKQIEEEKQQKLSARGQAMRDASEMNFCVSDLSPNQKLVLQIAATIFPAFYTKNGPGTVGTERNVKDAFCMAMRMIEEAYTIKP